jgi:ABC-type nitrate/sulfonate/bicarbonate transport system substrate-binding protein
LAISNVKILGIALVIVLAGLGYFAANKGESVKEETPIALKTIYFGYQPLWTGPASITEVMKRDKILAEKLKELGYEVKWRPFLKGSDVNVALQARGDEGLEFGLGGDMPTTTVLANLDIEVLSLVEGGKVWIISKNYDNVAQLKGKKIGFAFGSNAHYFLLKSLDQNNIPQKDVTLVQLDVPNMPQALENGEIDAFSAWEPTPTLAIIKFPSLKRIDSGRSSGYIYAKGEFARANHEAVKYIIASEIRAIKYIQKNQQNLDQTSKWAIDGGTSKGSSLGLTVEEYNKIVSDGIPSSVFIEDKYYNDGGILNDEFELLKNLGKIPQSAVWSESKTKIKRDLVKEVLSDAKKYRLEESPV